LYFTHMNQLSALASIALDLTRALGSADRYDRLLEALGGIIPFDAAALMRMANDTLTPMATRGLSPDTMGRKFLLADHPRLEIICRSHDPVLLPAETRLPDPFDGLVAGQKLTSRIHACLGCPLYIGEEIVGVLTADAFDPQAFSGLDREFLRAVSALSAAEMHTAYLLEALERDAERQGMIAGDLMRDVQLRQGTHLIGRSAPIEHLRREIELVAQSDFTVLILGETGVGKELVARAIHTASGRRQRPLIYLNCAALPETLADSELFGHTRGAFTGASRDRAGKFEVAEGGTLFLDEIGELPTTIQPKLLRAIQEGEIQRVGSNTTTHVNVRLLAATNRDLEAEVNKGRFREDLFHRLNVYPLAIPPLRERPEDIPLLAGHFCERIQRQLGLGTVRPAADAMARLASYAWPGNVRELENVISRAILKAAAGFPRGEPVRLESEHLSQDIGVQASAMSKVSEVPTLLKDKPLRVLVEDYERDVIRRSLLRNAGNWSAAARELGLHRSNLHHLAKRLGLKASAG
jgi:anaerobic nitric oxide reductase transcription regulator